MNRTPYELNPIHEAIMLAEEAHRGQKRKGSDAGYIVHPLEVLHILSTMNASQELLIAGILHDTVEDTDITPEHIREQFGDRVAELVASHTEDKNKTWKERKQGTIDELRVADRDTRLLIMADKVSNLRSMLSDYSRIGDALWERFNAPKELQVWCNRGIRDALSDMQHDEDAKHVYNELAELCGILFD